MNSVTNFLSIVSLYDLQNSLTLPSYFKFPATSKVAAIDTIEAFPLITDCVSAILDRLPLLDRNRAREVCKSWRKIENYEGLKIFLSIAQFHQKTLLALSPDLREVDGLLPSDQEGSIAYLQNRLNAIFAKTLFNSALSIVSLVQSNHYLGMLTNAQLPYFLSAKEAGVVPAFPILACLYMANGDSGSACFVINEGVKKRELICKLFLGKCYQTGADIAIPGGRMHLNKDNQKAIRCLQDVAKSGRVCGYRELGLFYANEPTRQEEAIQYLKWAAENKDPLACKKLAEIYANRGEQELANEYLIALEMFEPDGQYVGNDYGKNIYNSDVCVNDTASINTFPSELIEKIFSYLSFSSLRTGCLTCKKWKRLLKLKNNPRLWKQAVFQQDSCCSKLWNQHLGEISAIEQDGKTRDPALRLKEMGFVGLSARGEEVIRTIIAERCSPLKEEIKKRSIQITSGVLLCGPPGTGKTLLVRSLSSLLNCEIKNIHLLSGSKIYNRWKERSEVDVGKIFMKTLKAAEASTNRNEIFLLVIDKIDAILSRCSNEDGNSWMGSAVNDFLVQMNTLRNMYNILVIGTTNHLENIDKAATELGHFDEYIEIAIPDFQERKELLHMYTLPVIKHGLLATDIDYDVLALESEGLTGADINAFIKQAMACTMQKMMENISHDEPLEGSTLLTMNDLCLALNKVKARGETKWIA